MLRVVLKGSLPKYLFSAGTRLGEELLLVRNYMMGTILGELDGPFHIMAKWKNIILNQLPDSFFYDSIHTIKTISAEELMEVDLR